MNHLKDKFDAVRRKLVIQYVSCISGLAGREPYIQCTCCYETLLLNQQILISEYNSIHFVIACIL